MTTRKQQARAIIQRMKGGDFLLITPDDQACIADSIADADWYARKRGAVLIEYRNVTPLELRELRHD